MKQSKSRVQLLAFTIIGLFVLGCGAELGLSLHRVAEEVTVTEWGYPDPGVDR